MKTVRYRFQLIAGLCLLLCAVHIVNALSGYQLSYYGIRPRVPNSLPFIFTAPFLHGSFWHLANNLFGFIIFSGLCMLHSVRRYLWSSLFIITFGGFLVWLFGRPAVHIGASGWIFGLWSLSIAIAWFDRRLINIAIALFVLLFYGGMIYGVLPYKIDISFEGHLFGAFAGVVYAFLVTRRENNKKV